MKNSTTTQQLHSGKLANNRHLSSNYFYTYGSGSCRIYLDRNIRKQYLKVQVGIRRSHHKTNCNQQFYKVKVHIRLQLR